MATFTKNKRTGDYDVIGLAGEIVEGGSCTVTKRDGSTKTVTIGRVSKPFAAKFGPLKGQQCVIGTVVYHRAYAGGGYDDGMVRCCHCGQMTAEGDDWCMACGRAGYER